MCLNRVSADYNVFGYDPKGFIAHLAAWFYGPDWRPRYLGPRPVYVGMIQPPRYGPPASHQIPCLPKEFAPCSPPHHYGTPHPPYLPPPKDFHPDLASVAKGLQCSRLLDAMEARPVTVTYVAQDLVENGFEILTNTTWGDFQSEICSRLDINLDESLVRFAYRLCEDGIYSGYSPLGMDLDWCLVMMSVCRRKKDNLEVEIDILKLRKPRKFVTCLEGGRILSSWAPDIKTYAFVYPGIAELFDRLNVQDYLLDFGEDEDSLWGQDILEVLEGAAMEFIDELTLSSPRSLHLATGIQAWRISLIYKEAMEMIKEFHTEMMPVIEDIEKVSG